MIVYFRADANYTIATGHIMRCSTIAAEFVKFGHTIKFIIADKEPLPLLESFGFDYYIINTEWDNMDSEINILAHYIDSNPCDLLFVDSYFVTTTYFKMLHSHTKLAYIDDFCSEIYDVDYILNDAMYASDLSYNDFYPTNVVKLLGPKYTPLRSNFYNMPKHPTKKNIDNILLLTGGSDKYHFAKNFINAFISYDTNITVHVVCGVFNTDLTELQSMASLNSHIHVHVNISNIEELMCLADIAISAGGSTIYELAVCGTPTITYSLADNQLYTVAKWNSLHLMEYSGDIRNNFSFENLIDKIKKLSNDYERRKTISKALQDETVNPFGANAIVSAITASLKI